MLVEILVIVIMVIVYFILYELATTNPLKWHLPHLVDNTNTFYLGDQHWQQTVLVYFKFLIFCANQVAYVSISQSVCASVCNPSQVFKNPLWWDLQWPFGQKMIKTQWLASGEWCCLLDNDKKLVVRQPNIR